MSYGYSISKDRLWFSTPGIDIGYGPKPAPIIAESPRNPRSSFDTRLIVVHIRGYKTWNGVGRAWRYVPAHNAVYRLTSKTGAEHIMDIPTNLSFLLRKS